MYKVAEKTKRNLPDVYQFIEKLENTGDFFDENAEIFITRAPGRLDVMGGIADYSGSLVLEMPIAEAVLVALQKNAEKSLKIVSSDGSNQVLCFEMPLETFYADGKLTEYEQAQAFFEKDAANHWGAYAAGTFLVLMRERGANFNGGARIYVSSNVPEGKGVSSSAAFETAVMSAVVAAFGIKIEVREIAVLCQKVENLIVGAPCGIMDQMSVACGGESQLFSMICQPAEIQSPVVIPDKIAFWGIDSGIRHSVGGGDYGSVRTGTFIGYRIIADLAGFEIRASNTTGLVEIYDAKWNGYLANITPEDFEKHYAAHLPKEISGADFLEKYKGTTDFVTRVSPDKTYAVLNPTAHPIYENERVRRFAELLQGEITEDVLQQLGALMFASHKSYSACGLGSEGTDLLVKLISENKDGLYGAKITGGGSGGTVAILGKKNSERAIAEIAAEYKKQTNYQPYIFSGSSPGAGIFGAIKCEKINKKGI